MLLSEGFVTVSMILLEVIGSKGSEGSKGFSNESMNASVIISFGVPKNHQNL